MIITELLYDLSILVVLSSLSGFVIEFFIKKNEVKDNILQGSLFGIIAIIGIAYPFVYAEGIIFDGRTIVVGLCSMFYGPVAGFVSGLLASIFRAYVGGEGVTTGILFIVGAYAVGIYYYKKFVKTDIDKLTNIRLIEFGFIIHVIMLALLLTLFREDIGDLYDKIWLTVIIAFPLITFLVGRILLEIKRNSLFANKIAEKEELHKTTLYSIGEAVITSDIDGKITQLNFAAEEITGWKEKEAIGKPLKEVFNIISETTRERVENPAEKVIKHGKVVALANHTILIARDGTEIPITDSGAPIYNNERKIVGVVLVFRDQTNERNLQKAIRESEEKYRTLFERSKDAKLIIDGNVFTDCNEAAIQMLGLKSKEELCNTHPAAISPDYQPDGILSYEKAETMMKIAKSKGSHRFEWLHRKANGEEFYVEVSLTIIPYYNKELIHTAWRNITDRKKAEENIVKLSKGIEYSPATVVISDTEGNIEYVNPKFIEVSGYSFNDVQGQNIRILKSGYHDDGIYKELWETISVGKVWKGELLNKKKNGELFWEKVSISPIRNERGDISNYIAIKEDITAHKKMMEDLIIAKKKAEKTNQLKSEFLAQMSHEIRSPINTMVSFTGLIQEELEGQMSSELKTCFSGIESSSKRVIRTIDLILNMSELQLGTYEISTREINVSSILQSLYREYMKMAALKYLKLNLEIPQDDIIINSDEYAVNQIVANLIDNAIKYTNEGKVEISLKQNTDGRIIVQVTDTGIGISSEYLGHLFEPFSQEEQGYSRKFEGNGLGMSLVKRYCDLIEAEISVESEKGKGTKFTVILNK